MSQPPSFADLSLLDHVCCLQKAIYGLKQAPRSWFQRLSNFLVQYRFVQCCADQSMFIFRQSSNIMILLLYVDDIILTGNTPSMLSSFVTNLGAEFELSDLGTLSYFLGLTATCSIGGLCLSQTKYTIDLLRWYAMTDCKPCSTPICAKTQLYTLSGDPLSDVIEYHQLVGSLQYLTFTRHDIAYAVNHVAQFMRAPQSLHLIVPKLILQYLKGSLDFGLLFRSSTSPLTIKAYFDTDWPSCPDSRHSTMGICVFLGSNLISWTAKKQPTVSRSSAEAEYRALAHVCAKTTWVSHLLQELHLPTTAPITLLCDNLSTTYMVSNPMFHARTKHIELDYHFIRERILSRSHRVQFVPSLDQLADIFTRVYTSFVFNSYGPTLSLLDSRVLGGSVKPSGALRFLIE